MLKALAAVVLLASACGEVKDKGHLADAPPAPDSPLIDGPMADAPPPRCDPAKPFNAPVAVTELNTGGNDFTPSLSADELTIVFSSTRAGGVGMSDIYIATRTSPAAAFGAPSLVANVNTTGNDSRPVLTADGLTMYIEYLANPNSAWDIVKATRSATTAQFSAPQAVLALDTASNEVAPYVTPDHTAIYFVSNRSGNNEIYVATGTGGNFGAPMLASGTNLQSMATEDYPLVTPDQLTLYFASDRSGATAGTHIWVAKRASVVTGFNAPTQVAELVGPRESPGWISPDGCVMYFNRDVGVVAANFEIYRAVKPL